MGQYCLFCMGNKLGKKKKSNQVIMGGDVTSTQTRRKVTLPPGYSQLHWMRLTQSGKDLSGLRGAPPRRKILMAEVNQHNTEEDCWSVLDGKVYNITPYMRFHPGGIPYLMMSAGGDCTDLFNEYHPWVNAHGMLDKCYIGELDPDSVVAKEGDAASSKFALDKNEWRAFKLLSKQRVANMTVKFTFELPMKKYLGLEIPGQHLKIRATINGKVIERAYTPSSKFTQAGSFDLLIKLYPDGHMSQYLESLDVGATIEMLGPQGVIGYASPGKITRGKTTQDATHLVMIAGGSGITPMLQLIRAVFESLNDASRITLIYSNKSLDHIIALDQLEPLASIYPAKFKLYHILSTGSADDKSALGTSLVGRLDKALLQEYMPDVSPSVGVFVCGPPKFEDAITGHLSEIGFDDSQVYLF
uniref:Cytochrome-b5 reductase n=1 Tax=Globisporangium ultimum (strain ATCC 200006 / CBS 805.95 / DAOM BR144) TaxID=431595 RepID=K3WW71_GLOUD